MHVYSSCSVKGRACHSPLQMDVAGVPDLLYAVAMCTMICIMVWILYIMIATVPSMQDR